MSPTELRAAAMELEAIRGWLMSIQGASPGTRLATTADSLEWRVLRVEDKLHAAADRLDPPKEVTGQQWLRGLTVQAVRP